MIVIFSVFCRPFKLLQNNVFVRDLSNYRTLLMTKSAAKHIKPVFRSIAVIGGGVITVSVIWQRNRAKCDLNDDSIVNTNIIEDVDLKTITKTIKEESFDFKRLWSFLKPDSLYLLIAISVRILL